MVSQAMDNAFDFSQAALDALSSLGDGSANEAQHDLLKYLFLESMPSPDKVDPHEVYFEKLVGMYEAILKFKERSSRPKDGPLPVDDVIVYCDHSRFLVRQNSDGSRNKTHSYDQDSQTMMKWAPLEGCKGSVNIDDTYVGSRSAQVAIMRTIY